MDEPVWISLELATALHHRQLAEHGGAAGVRDTGLLDSALNRPRHLYAYSDPKPSLPALAAAYGFGIARNHAFIDGNKRTAAVVCELFLELNGWSLIADDTEMYPIFLALGAGEIDEEGLAEWLGQNAKKKDQ